MDPKEFNWTEDQQVTVTNPTADVYNFQVHGKAYQLGSGKTAKMAGYIAWVYVYGMAGKLCQEAGEWARWNEENFRKEYYDKVVVGADETVQTVEVQEDPGKVETFEADETPAPGTGVNYEPKAKVTNGRTAKV